jgi:hypothetical protein
MNGCSHPKHENGLMSGRPQTYWMKSYSVFILNLVNRGYWEGTPPQGLGTARRGKFGFRENRELRPPRERPRGGGGTYHNGGMGASAPIINLLV